MAARFITASGTGIGKTLVVAALAWQLRQRGRQVCAFKPVISGTAAETVAESDSGQLLMAQGLPITEEAVDGVSPWRFGAALAPDMAAARDGRRIDFESLIAFCKDAVAHAEQCDGVALIEGVGGVMVPLTKEMTVIDWIAATEIPAVLVVGSYLGALSHALTAADVLKARRISIDTVIVNESIESPVSLAETVATLRRFLPPTKLIAVERISLPEHPWKSAPDLTPIVAAS